MNYQQNQPSCVSQLYYWIMFAILLAKLEVLYDWMKDVTLQISSIFRVQIMNIKEMNNHEKGTAGIEADVSKSVSGLTLTSRPSWTRYSSFFSASDKALIHLIFVVEKLNCLPTRWCGTKT